MQLLHTMTAQAYSRCPISLAAHISFIRIAWLDWWGSPGASRHPNGRCWEEMQSCNCRSFRFSRPIIGDLMRDFERYGVYRRVGVAVHVFVCAKKEGEDQKAC